MNYMNLVKCHVHLSFSKTYIAVLHREPHDILMVTGLAGVEG